MYYHHFFTSKIQCQTNPRVTHSKLQHYTLSVFIFYIHIYLSDLSSDIQGNIIQRILPEYVIPEFCNIGANFLIRIIGNDMAPTFGNRINGTTKKAAIKAAFLYSSLTPVSCL